jgi:hypothetical protein
MKFELKGKNTIMVADTKGKLNEFKSFKFDFPSGGKPAAAKNDDRRDRRGGPDLKAVNVKVENSGTIRVNVDKQFGEGNNSRGIDDYEVQFKEWRRGMTEASLARDESDRDDRSWKDPSKPVSAGSNARPQFMWSLTARADLRGMDDGVAIRARAKDKRGWGPWTYSLAPNNRGWK